MKKILTVFLSAFLIWGSLFAEKKVSLTVTPDFGVVQGKINEFVYYVPNPEGSGVQNSEIRKMSELNWDAFWIPYLGSSFSVELDTGSYVNFGFDAGIPKSSGVMVDRDWINCVYFPDKNWLTNYSKHENNLLSYYNIDFSMGQKFSFSRGFAVKPELFVTNNVFSFYGEKGTGKYGKNWQFADDGELVEPAESGEDMTWKSVVISYKQNRVFAGLGLEAEKAFNFGLALCLFGKVRFAYVQAEDYHYNTTTDYLDKPYGFGGILAGGSVSYSFNEKHKISLKGTYDWLPLILGPDYINEYEDFWSTDSHYIGGASSSLMTLSLSYTYSF